MERTNRKRLAALLFMLGALVVLRLVAGETLRFTVVYVLTVVVIALCLLLLIYFALRLVVARWPGRLGVPRSPFRREAERIVIGQMATVMRQNLPTASALAVAAESETGRARAALQRISKLLAQGAPLAQAVRHGYPECSTLVLSLIMAGEKAGQLPAALEQAEADLVERNRRRTASPTAVWPYLWFMLFSTIVVFSGMMLFVMPKFRETFRDYKADLPRATVRLIHASNWFVGVEEVAPNVFVERFPGWILVLLLLLAACGFWLRLRRRRVPDPTLASRIADSIRWNVPGWRKMEFARGMSAALRVLRLGVCAGLDVARSARLAAGIDVNAHLRSRMTRFAELAASGTNLRTAAAQAGLGEVAGIALAAGQRGHRLEDALRYAAEYYDALFSRAWTVLRNLLWPVSTLMVATVVGAVAYGLFTPLVALLDATCDAWGN